MLPEKKYYRLPKYSSSAKFAPETETIPRICIGHVKVKLDKLYHLLDKSKWSASRCGQLYSL
jgi:hypothetical protein